MGLRGIVETALYVDDVAIARDFYHRVFGLTTMADDERFCAFDVGDRCVLLLFKKGATTEPLAIHDGVIPPHDGDGQNHFAFAVDAQDLPAWEDQLRAEGIAVEGRVTWPKGGRSVYFRDPDGNLVELATPGIWPNY